MGKKSRAKRLIREGQVPPAVHVHSRHRQAGLTPVNQWVLLGALIVFVVGIAFIARSALSSSALPSSAEVGNATSVAMQDQMNKYQGANVGQHVAMASVKLPATSGGPVDLSTYRGKKLVVYLYEGIT